MTKALLIPSRAVDNPVQYHQIRGFSSSYLSTVLKVIAFAIVLFALANLPKAEAGPIAYSSCCSACAAASMALPIALPACLSGCIPFLSAPTL